MAAEDLTQQFSQVYEETFDKIFNYILKRVQNLTIAQDVTSETFYKAVRYIKAKNAEIEKMENWLYTIASNEIKQYYRKNNRIFFFSPQEFKETPSYETPESEIKKIRA